LPKWAAVAGESTGICSGFRVYSLGFEGREPAAESDFDRNVFGWLVYPLAYREAHKQMTKMNVAKMAMSQKISTVRFAALASARAIRSSGETSSSTVSPAGIITNEARLRAAVN
jgi:hypothetical protein